MEITYLGHASFKIRAKLATLITDPFDPSVGLKFPKHLTADIVTVSHDHPDHNATSEIDGSPFIIRGPGEYEISGVSVVGLSSFHDESRGSERGKNTIYRIEIEGVSIVHLGDLGHPLTTGDVEALNGVDILLVPTGGFYTIDAKTAAQIVHEVDPYIVIPMHFGRAELNQKTFSALSPVAVFLKEMGKSELTSQSKLIVTRDKLPEELQVVVLE